MMDNEQMLLRRYAQSRDAMAFRELVDEHKGMVFAACRRVLGNRADAEDAAQNCFLKLSQAAGRLKAPIGGWLHTVAVHAAIDILRSENARKARERSVAVHDIATSEAHWEDVEGELDTALESLSERLRVPIVLYFLEGRTQEDVAASLGVSPRSMVRRLDRGIEVLRRRLKRAGIVAPVVALTAMLSANTAEAAPAALTVTLGKIALTGAGGAQAAAATGGTLVTLKTAVVIAVAAAGAGAVVVHQATKPPHPTPLAAATPVAKKVLRTPEAVLNAELTLTTGALYLNELGELIKDQIGVNAAYHVQGRKVWPFVSVGKPGKHKVRDVLAAINASALLRAEVASDKDGVVVCFWKKPNVAMLAEMMKLAASNDVVERCTAARWLETVGGREALVQLLKMLADPDARVRYFAANSVVDGWTGAGRSAAHRLVSCVAPEGTGLVVAKAIETGAAAATGTWRETQRNIFRIARRLRSPNALPALKKQLERMGGKERAEDTHTWVLICAAIADIGGPEAEAIMLAAMDRLPDPGVYWFMRSLGALGTDGAIAQLSKRVDIEVNKGERGRYSPIIYALGVSDSPAAARELLRILNLPGIDEGESDAAVRKLVKFDTPAARAVCLSKLRTATDPGKRYIWASQMVNIPAVREMLLGELAQGGAVARSAALLLATTRDPRIVPTLVDILADGPTRGARRQAIDALGRIGGPEADKALIALVNGDGTLRRTAVSALGHSASPEARKVLRAALQDADSDIRRFAARALALRPDPTDIAPLLACARGADFKGEREQRGWAIWTAVATIGGEHAAGELVAEAARGHITATCALLASEDPHGIKAVRDALAGDDVKLRKALMTNFESNRALPLSGYYAAGAVLAELPTADAHLRSNYAVLLGSAQDPRATEPLGKLLVDADEPLAVRRAAAWGLSIEEGDPAAVEPLRHALEHDTDKVLKRMAKNALMDWGVIPREQPKQPRPPNIPDPQTPPDEREFPPPPDP